MGCCSSRYTLIPNSNKQAITNFLEVSKLNSFSCADIKLLDSQLLTTKIDQDAYQLFAKSLSIQAPFELFAIQGVIKKFDFMLALLMFSKDTFEHKKELYNEFVKENPRNLMAYLEWRYRLANEKIPKELIKLGKIDKMDGFIWIESSRVRAGIEIASLYSNILIDSRIINSLNLLNIN